MSKNIFVFVVCGTANHINTLNFSIHYLQHYSTNEIIVITDNKRNEIPVNHNNIIDISTPSQFNNHQASIWIKTSLHKFLPEGNTYCYLDSDVIAADHQVDSVFNYHVTPITFSADHCTINYFSPAALNCGCLEKSQKRQQEFEKLLQSALPGYDKKKQLLDPEYRELYQDLLALKQHPVKNFRILTSLLFPSTARNKNKIMLNKKIYFDAKKRNWHNTNGDFITKDTMLSFPKEIKNSGKFRFNRFRNTWVDNTNTPVYKNSCDHLVIDIKNTFSVQIRNNNWQHWNGGVFLFNDDSKSFLEAWHTNTMKIFSDPRWRIRDQGTLAATAWQFGLQDKKLLPSEYNFLADFYNPGIMLNSVDPITINNNSKIVMPHFLHVYHEFGNTNWDLWNAIINLK